MSKPLYQLLAARQQAIANCERTGNKEWQERHEAVIDELVRQYMPHGSGLNNGVTYDNVRSSPSRLVLNTSFHHMNSDGYYDGWTEHSIVVTPAFHGIDIRITGRDRNNIKDYLAEVFYCALTEPADETSVVAAA